MANSLRPKIKCELPECKNGKTSIHDKNEITLESQVPPSKKLFTAAIPSLKLPNNNEPAGISSSDEDMKVKQASKEMKKPNKSQPSAIPVESYEWLLKEYRRTSQTNNNLKKQLYVSKITIKNKSTQIRKLVKEVTNLHLQIEKDNTENAQFEEALKYFFTRFQKHTSVDERKDGVWSNKALITTLGIMCLSRRCYSYLCENLVLRLPEEEALHKFITNITIKPGILHDLLNIMEVTSQQLSYDAKITVLQLGSMKIKPTYEKVDELLGSHSYMQVIMATGLFEHWKQPVYLGFNMKITRNILINIINKLEDMSYAVCACISDCSDSIINLWNELNLSPVKSYFRNPVSKDKVHCFVEAPSLLNRTRNMLLDKQFSFNSSVITKRHINCTRLQKNETKLASELFSHETATELKKISPDETQAYIGMFIENIANLYSLMKNSYGLRLDEHNSVLNDVTDMINKLQVGHDEHLLVLQGAILMSINSLRSLPLYIWEKYNTLFAIPMEKLCNNELKNLFSQIHGDLYKVGSVTPSAALTRLRMILVGEINEDKNVKDYITRQVLLSLASSPRWKNMEDDRASVSPEPQDKETIEFSENDEVHYLVVSVAQRFLSTHPELSTHSQTLLADGNFNSCLVNDSCVEPSKSWFTQARQLNKLFEKYCKMELLSGKSEVIMQLMNIVSKLYPSMDFEVAQYFMEERLAIRIKHLNMKLGHKQKHSK